MRKIRLAVGLAAIACVLGAGAASAYATSSFEAKLTEKLAGKQIGTEEFTVYPMTVSCNKAVSKGETTDTAGKSEITITTTYALCTTLGGLIRVTVSPAEWEYKAEREEHPAEGAIRLANTVTVKPAIGTGCKYEIPEQEPEPVESKELTLYEDGFLAPTGKGNFKTEGQEKLSISTKFSGLKYTATGWPCTGPKSAEALREERTETSEGEGGKFVGGTKLEATNGDLTWHFVP